MSVVCSSSNPLQVPIWRVSFGADYRYYNSEAKATLAVETYAKDNSVLDSDACPFQWTKFDGEVPMDATSRMFHDVRLGFSYNSTKQPIDRILTRSGENHTSRAVRGTDNFSRHGSTNTMATFEPKNREECIAMLGGSPSKSYHFILIGEVYTWSHLPRLTIEVNLLGVCVDPVAFEGDAWVRKSLQMLLEKDECAFVFELLSIRDISRKATWQGPKKKLKAAVRDQRRQRGLQDVYTGNALKGFFPTDVLNMRHIKAKDVQRICNTLASYAVPGVGRLNLFQLDGKVLRMLLRQVPSRQRALMVHRILNAAKFHRKSDLYVSMVPMFPATYGQYLVDDVRLLKNVRAFFDSTVCYDAFFYDGAMNGVFARQPFQVQVQATCELWEHRFPERMVGWKARFDVWKTWKDIYFKSGKLVLDTYELLEKHEVNETVLSTFIDMGYAKEVDSYVRSNHCYKKICFPSHYDMMGELLRLLHDGMTTKQMVVDLGTVADGLLLYPNQAMLDHVGARSGIDMQSYFVKVRYKGQFEDDTGLLPKIISQLRTTGKTDCVLLALEYWPADSLAFVLSLLQGTCRIHLHFLGFHDYPKLTISHRRLIPLYKELEHCDWFTAATTEKVESKVNERWVQTKEELLAFIEEWKALPAMDRFSWNNGYGIVVHSNKELENAKAAFHSLLPSDDGKFHASDRVSIKASGVVSHVCTLSLKHVDRTSQGIEKHLYLDSSILLAHSNASYKATALEHAFIVLANKITAPIPNMILFGKVPNYLLRLCRDYLAINELVIVSHESLDDVISQQQNSPFEISLQRETCLPYWIEQLEDAKKAEKEAEQAAAVDAIHAERKRKLERLFAQEREKSKQKMHKN